MKNQTIIGWCALLAVLGSVACSASSESASNDKLGVSAAALGVDGGVDGGADGGADAGDAGQ